MVPPADFDFILEPLFMRRLLRMVALSSIVPVPMVPVPIVPVPLFMVPLFMVPVAGVLIVPVAGVLIVPVPVVVGVVPVVGVVWAKAALAQRAKAAARKEHHI